MDNVLERFLRINEEEQIIAPEQILRVATDSFKVNQALRNYTVESRVGGEINRDSRRREKAEKLVNKAQIVFTTCAGKPLPLVCLISAYKIWIGSGAGLGVLRSVDFDIILIDEASQVTEAVALIPLVKGCKKAILVGDQ